MTFNPTKTEYLIFTKKLVQQVYPDLYLDGKKLTRVNKHKQLGVTFNSKMMFDDHIRENCKKAMNRITALKRLHGKLPRRSKLTIYMSFIRPVLEFGWQLYDNSSNELLDSLERVQREGLLLVTSAYKKTSHNALLHEVGVPLLATRRHTQKIQFMYKYTENKLPPYMNQIIPNIVDDGAFYNLRNKNNIKVPLSKKNYFLKSFIPSSIKTWNDTNREVREASSLEALKTKLSSIYGINSYRLFLYQDGKGAVNQSRIRMGLSALNLQRKKYHFIPNPSCDQCNARSETPQHFLLYCPAYAVQRNDMLQELSHGVPNISQLLLNFYNNNNMSRELVRIMIYGTGKIDDDEVIFQAVHLYLEETKCFN